MTTLCPTCNGKGSIPDPKLLGTPMHYVGPNGEGCPEVFCHTCSGTGWVSGDKHCSCQGHGLNLKKCHPNMLPNQPGFAGDPRPPLGGSLGDPDRGYAVSWTNPSTVSW